MAARLDEDGGPVLLEAQDRRRWDQLLIRRGLAALRQAELLAAGQPVGKYFLQASIAAPTPAPRSAEDTDWRRIASSVRRPGRRRAGTGRRGEPGGSEAAAAFREAAALTRNESERRLLLARADEIS